MIRMIRKSRMIQMTQYKNYLLIFLFQSILFACSSNKSQTIDLQCHSMIKMALSQHDEISKSLVRADNKLIANLITAARIQQQHGKFPDCIDKANRALVLIKNHKDIKN